VWSRVHLRAYFVRSRVTGAGPNEVELLWPADNQWPPEIDFNESGGSLNSSSSTIHFSAVNEIDQRSILISMSQWHTWGVIWTPKSVSYVVDGQVWGTITTPSEISRIPMTLTWNSARAAPRGISVRPTPSIWTWIGWPNITQFRSPDRLRGAF